MGAACSRPSSQLVVKSVVDGLSEPQLDEFRAVWDSVYTLALYDWNGDGLQGRQFSSVINRLVCREAERVHSWVARVESTRECW